jgi:hypothetical protein
VVEEELVTRVQKRMKLAASPLRARLPLTYRLDTSPALPEF